MLLISHRGNQNGPRPNLENQPLYIDTSLNEGFDCEIDLWLVDNQIFLGHDLPQYKIEVDWLISRKEHLWLHCKNIQIFEYLRQRAENFNFFWHQEDTLALTSGGFVWVYPGKQPIENSIAVLPEIFNDDISNSIGICSDFIEKYKIKSSE